MYKHSCGRDGGCVPLCVDLLCNNLSHLLLFLLPLPAWPSTAFSFFFQALAPSQPPPPSYTCWLMNTDHPQSHSTKVLIVEGNHSFLQFVPSKGLFLNYSVVLWLLVGREVLPLNKATQEVRRGGLKAIKMIFAPFPYLAVRVPTSLHWPRQLATL